MIKIEGIINRLIATVAEKIATIKVKRLANDIVESDDMEIPSRK